MRSRKILDLEHPIMAMAMSPDGTLVAFDRMQASDGTTTLALLHLESEQLILFGEAQRQAVVSISFSLDGKRLLVGIRTNPQAEKTSVQVWNVENRLVPVLQQTVSVETRATATVSGDMILIESRDRADQVTHTFIMGDTERRFTTPIPAFAVAVNAAMRIIALQEPWQRNVDLWRAEPVPSFVSSLGPQPGPVSRGNFSPDGGTLALGQGDYGCHVQLWDTSSPQHVRMLSQMKGHKGHISALAFSSDMQLLASGSYDRTILVWDISNPLRSDFVQILDGHEHTITEVVFTPDRKQLISTSIDGTIRQWSIGA